MKTFIGILSYNLPKITDNLYEQLQKLIVDKKDVFFCVFDNGSDQDKISKYVTHKTFLNTRLTGGMNHILNIAKSYNPDYVWLLTSDIKFEYEIDPLKLMIGILEKDKQIGVLHPSLIEPVQNYAYQWMCKKSNENGCTKNHVMVDFIAPLYTKEALNVIDWKFDEKFIYGWGTDYDGCWNIRKNKLSIAVNFDVLLSHQTSITYDSGNDKEFKNRNEYYKKAGENMNQVMTEKYGNEWAKLIYTKFEWEK